MPKVIFRIDKEEEVKNLILFSSKYDTAPLGGKTLFERLMIGRKNVLNKIRKMNIKERKKFIQQYIKREYKKLDLKKNKQKIEKDWSKIEKNFFRDAEKLFDNHKWHSKKYFAYISILSSYPRYLKQNKFFIPKDNKRKSIRYVIIHELLHFLYYDFFNTKFKRKLKDMPRWHFSEIINFLLMDEKQLNRYYKKLNKQFPLEDYPKEDSNRLLSLEERCKTEERLKFGFFKIVIGKLNGDLS